MRLPEPADFILFSNWDGYLLAFGLFVVSALMRVMSKIQKLDWKSTEMTVMRRAVYACRGGALLMALIAWGACPDRSPGIWGTLAIGLIIMSYGNAIWMIRKGKPLF